MEKKKRNKTKSRQRRHEGEYSDKQKRGRKKEEDGKEDRKCEVGAEWQGRRREGCGDKERGAREA